MRGVPAHGVSAERRAKEERAVLLRLARSRATMGQLTDDLAARLGPRVAHAVDRLQDRGLVASDGKPRAEYWLTDKGKALAEQLTAGRAA